MCSNVVEVLPAVHALTGCDTTSKVGTKLSALQTAEKYGYELLSSFGTSDITDEMIKNAEKFLVRCIDHNSHVDTFDDLRNQIYHRHSFKLDLERLPPTSSSIVQHIKRAFLQCFMWLNAPFAEHIELIPQEYGYAASYDTQELLPIIMHGPCIPEDFPVPCNCVKCAKSNVCPCRVKNITCCQFCKCGSSVDCRNPMK
jgi:hypothetical protein